MSEEFADLGPGEVEIPVNEPSELLFRQISDHSWDPQVGRPHSHSFGPQPIDSGKPSFSRETKVTAQEARDWHNANANSKSRGVWGCSVEEVVKAGSRAIDDSESAPDPGIKRAPGHAFVDYRHISQKKGSDKVARQEIRSQLLMYALARGEIPTVDNS